MGNWLGSPGAAGWMSYNADNEILGAATNAVDVTGEVEPGPASNKWYNTWAECRGVSMQVNTNDGSFSCYGLFCDRTFDRIVIVRAGDSVPVPS